ncbi:MAG: hypothetical protein IPG92_10955 [Flavobacteriales bacterium]|nr:hypothetical protein [Flavobacteriales bacterium]
MKLKELAAQAGGEAPAPLPPSPPLLKELSAQSGNDLLFAIFDKADELGTYITNWKDLRQRIATRLPDYRMTQDLLAFAQKGELPGLDEQLNALKAVADKRDLLPNPILWPASE